MAVKLLNEYLNGIKLFKYEKYTDARGFFAETYNFSDLRELGINNNFIQDNISRSKSGVIRGLHFQWDKPLSKLIRVSKGSAKFFELDIRKNSPTFAKFQEFNLNEFDDFLLWVPAGFANGFLALENDTEIQYKCDELWNPNGEAAIIWNDKSLNIPWNHPNPIISNKDAKAFSFKNWIQTPESDILTFAE